MRELPDRLNEAQRQAVTHGEGPLLVLAGPGSGKTTVIVERIRYLIAQMHVPPERILVITFTKDAARSMQRRFQEQSDSMFPVNFGTFHSIFYHILLESFPRQSDPFEEGPSQPGSRMQFLNESRKKSILLPLLREIRQRRQDNGYSPDDLSSDALEMLSAISFYKNTGNEKSAAGKLSAEWKPYFSEVLEKYQRAVRKQQALDFDDMLYECRKLLEKDMDFCRSWQERFSHILIDEFQDINPMQYQVIKLLTVKPHNLFAVGDDDQAIYGFRGSEPAVLREFVREFGARQILLDVNYRSRPAIVEAAGKVIGENRNRYDKALRAVTRDAPESGECPVKILCFPDREQQNAYLRKQISDFLEREPNQSCAVLFRKNIFMQSFAAGLEKRGIPYVMREKTRNIYEHFVVQDVMAYLRFAAGDRRRSLFLRFMNKPGRYISREALADSDEIDLERLKQWYRERGARRWEYLEILDKLEVQLKAMAKMTPYLAVCYVCRAVGYERWLREQAGTAGGGRQEWLEILDWLKEDAKSYADVREWLEAQSEYASRADDGRAEKADAGVGGSTERNIPGAVQLMTAHAAKGLEFDRVWIPECNEKNFPNGNMQDAETIEEERRIFYVGMTRAKKSLELLWFTGTEERPRLMSRFLNPILNDYSSSSMSSSNSQLSRYSSKASATFSYSSSSSI